jgi:fibronectin type 3 domain-containing protein
MNPIIKDKSKNLFLMMLVFILLINNIGSISTGSNIESRDLTHPGFRVGTIFGNDPTDSLYISQVCVDADGNVYAAGRTGSDQFPTTQDAFDKTLSGSSDLFVTKFNSDLTSIMMSTLIGGAGSETVEELIISPEGRIFLTGSTNSFDFPTTNGAYCSTYGGEKEAYFLELNAQGTGLEYSTFIGGSDDDEALDMAIDSMDRILIVGHTQSQDFPITTEAYDITLGGGTDAFVLRFQADLADVQYSTYIGGPDHDNAFCVDHLLDDSFVILGHSQGSFPTTLGAYNESNGRGYYLLRMDTTGRDVLFSTMSPAGSGQDELRALDIDNKGSIYIVGSSESIDFPTTPEAVSRNLNETRDGIIFSISDDGKNLTYGTYLNSNGTNNLFDIAIDSNGTRLAVIGAVRGDGLRVTEQAFDDSWRGENENRWDGLVLVLDIQSKQIEYASYLGGSRQDILSSLAWSDRDVMVLGGRTVSDDIYVSHGAYQEIHPGADQGYIVKLDPRQGTSPGAPSNLRVYPTTLDVTLLWDPPKNTGGCRITDYRVEKINKTGVWVVVNETNTLRHVDVDVMNGVTHWYRVSAISLAGQGALATMSIEVPPVVPTPPLNLTASTGNGTITLTWSAPSWSGGADIEGYSVFKGPTSQEMMGIARLGDILSFVDTDVVMGEFNFYEVAARNSAGVGPVSNTVRIRALDVPSPPRDFDVEAHDGSVKLTWSIPSKDGGSMLIGFYIYRGTSIDNLSLLATKTVVQLLHVDSNVTNGRTYVYYITAFSDVGESTPSPALDATPFGLPGRVLDLVATPDDELVTLTWAPPDNDGGRPITKYKVLAGESAGSMSLVATIGNVTTFIHSDLTNGVTLHYTVFAVNEAGEGQISETVSATPMTLPGVPGDLVVESEKGGVRLTWTAPGDLGGAATVSYWVYRADNEAGIDAEPYRAYGALTFWDVNVTVGSTYYYRVHAESAFGAGETAGPVEVLVTTVPGVVGDLVTAYGDGEVQLTWTAPEDDGGSPIVEYVVKRGIFVTGLVEVGRVTTTSFDDTGLDNGKEYLYVVMAVNAIGAGDQSDVVEGKPLGPPTAPGLFKVQAKGKGLVLSWAEPTGGTIAPVTGYRIERAEGDGAYETLATIGLETSFTDEEVKQGKRYRYTVTALSDVGDGESTNEVEGKVKKPEESPSFSIVLSVLLLILVSRILSRTRQYP